MSNDATIEHRVVEVDGVRVHHFPSDSDVCSVALLFGVGQRDESLATQGTLHALEHLVMDAVRRTPISINASVDPSLTDFTADGSPQLVRAFLQGVCSGLAVPPVARLAAEAAVLRPRDRTKAAPHSVRPATACAIWAWSAHPDRDRPRSPPRPSARPPSTGSSAATRSS